MTYEELIELCPDCGSSEVYLTSYCNFLHCLECGAAIDEEHECWVPPDAMRAEMDGDFQGGIEILKEKVK